MYQTVPNPCWKMTKANKTLHINLSQSARSRCYIMNKKRWHTVLSLLQWESSLDDILSNIILLAQVEQFPDLGSSLGTKTTGLGIVGKSWNLCLTWIQIHIQGKLSRTTRVKIASARSKASRPEESRVRNQSSSDLQETPFLGLMYAMSKNIHQAISKVLAERVR